MGSPFVGTPRVKRRTTMTCSPTLYGCSGIDGKSKVKATVGADVRALGLGDAGKADGRCKVDTGVLRVRPTDPLVDQGRQLVFRRLHRGNAAHEEDGRTCGRLG